MTMKICIGGDVAPTGASLAAFCAGTAEALLDPGLAKLWFSADARVLNLETPLADADTPIHKCGPCLRAPLACAAGLAALRPDGVSLCNNHIMDQGAAGLRATLDALSARALRCFGAGESLAEADAPLVLEKNGLRVLVYAVAEHEFASAAECAPGANPLDELTLCERIRSLKNGADALIVLYHGSREHYPYPSPLLLRRCRKLAEWGADAVLCQHSHAVGCMERHAGATLLYGQGNFLFADDPVPCWETGLLCELTVGEGPVRAAFVPIARADAGGARLLTGEAAEALLSAFTRRSEEILRPGFAEAAFRAYAAEKREKLATVFLGESLPLRALNVLTGRRPLKRLYSRSARLALLNTLRCEAIRELTEAALEEQ